MCWRWVVRSMRIWWPATRTPTICTLDQTVRYVIQKRVGGAQTDLISLSTTNLTHAAGSFFSFRFQVVGSLLRMRAWPQGGAEGGMWDLMVTDTDLTGAGSVGVRSTLDSANTNTLPVNYSYDNFTTLNPQTFTVTRSINGVVKSQVAGEDLRLANPTIISL